MFNLRVILGFQELYKEIQRAPIEPSPASLLFVLTPPAGRGAPRHGPNSRGRLLGVTHFSRNVFFFPFDLVQGSTSHSVK